MTEIIEVCSLVEGAWFDVVSGECSIAWVLGKPHVRIKFMAFAYNECEYFGFHHLFQKRFRHPLTLVELDTPLEIGQKVVGLAKSENEQKWFDASIEKIVQRDGDVLVTVDWCLGMYVYVFGTPIGRVLSVVNGDIGLPSEPLDPYTHPVISQWTQALSELSGLQEKFENREDRIPLEPQPQPVSKIAMEPIEKWTPASLSVRKRASLRTGEKKTKKPKNNKNSVRDEQSESVMEQNSASKDSFMASGSGSVGLESAQVGDMPMGDIERLEVVP